MKLVELLAPAKDYAAAAAAVDYGADAQKYIAKFIKNSIENLVHM